MVSFPRTMHGKACVRVGKSVASSPGPTRKRRGPGIHCLHMRWIFMECHETVFSINVRVMLMSLSWQANGSRSGACEATPAETRIEFDSVLQHSLCRLGVVTITKAVKKGKER